MHPIAPLPFLLDRRDMRPTQHIGKYRALAVGLPVNRL